MGIKLFVAIYPLISLLVKDIEHGMHWTGDRISSVLILALPFSCLLMCLALFYVLHVYFLVYSHRCLGGRCCYCHFTDEETKA